MCTCLLPTAWSQISFVAKSTDRRHARKLYGPYKLKFFTVNWKTEFNFIKWVFFAGEINSFDIFGVSFIPFDGCIIKCIIEK